MARNLPPDIFLKRENFRPSQWLDQPYAMVAVNVVCADTDERAEWLSGPSALSFLRLRAGRPEPLASPDEAAAYPYSELERQFILDRREGQAMGSPETVLAQLEAVQARTGADDVRLTTLGYDSEARIRSFELVAERVAGGLRR